MAISPDGGTVAVGGWTGYEWDKQHSIYLFDRATGRLLRNLGGLPNVVQQLAFRVDGRALAVGLARNGVRVFDTRSGQLLGEDQAGPDVYGLAWYGDALAASSFDGKIRLYRLRLGAGSQGLTKTVERVAPGGKYPRSLAFSFDGTALAVGYRDTAVSVLDGRNLRLRFAAETGGLDSADTFGQVVWSADGTSLWAAGTLQGFVGGQMKFILRRWPQAGQGEPDDTPIADNTVMSLAALPDGGLVFGTADPAWGEINSQGHRVRFIGAPVRDYRPHLGPLQLSADSHHLKIGALSFALLGRQLATTAPLRDPRQLGGGLTVTDWSETIHPQLNGQPLALKQHEVSFSLALAADGQSFALGSAWALRRFNALGREVWHQPTPGIVWAVNLVDNDQTLVAAYGDGTIRWHRYSDGQELLALFAHPDNKRWVLWTPNGYFDASPGAEDLIGWHVNQGKDKEARFVKGGQLYARLYRPDLIDRAAAGEHYASFPAVNLETLLASGNAPKVSFVAPAVGDSATRDVILKYRVCDAGGGIGQRVLRINGMTVALAEGDRGLKPKSGARKEDCLDEEKLISLQPGDNTIALTAFNTAGQIESSPVELKLALKPNVPAGGKPTLHVLALAVDQYRDGDLRLAYSKKDAEGLIDNLKQVGGTLYGEIKVHTLFDDAVRKAGIGEKFDQLSVLVKPEDVFVLYMAGHGVTDREDGNYYYLPVDFRYSDVTAVRKQAISNTFFQENLAKIKAGKSLVLLDTCNSGSFQAVKTRGVEEKTAVARLVKATGRATIMASSSSQVALEGYEGHGVFTWALIQGLKGKAVKGGQITVGGLADYVGDTLPELTYKKFGYEQVPQRELQGMNFPIGVR